MADENKLEKMKEKIPQLPYGEGTITVLDNETYMYKKMISGKRKAVYGTTIQEVMKKMRQKENKTTTEQFEEKTVTLYDAMQNWLIKYKKPKLKKTSYDTLEKTIRSRIQDYDLGKMRLTEINSDMLQDHINYLNEEMHYSFSTIKKCYDALNDFYNNLYYSRKIEFSPMLIVQMPSRENVKPKKEIQFFDKEDLDKFISEATAKYKTKDLQKYQYGYCICANMFLGMRVGELLALRWADIDFDNNIIFVHSNLQLINNPKYDKNKKIEMKALDINKQIYEEQSIKTSQNRTIHMNNSAKKYLMLQREYSNFTKDSDFVCCTRDGKHAAITYISENIGRIEEVIDANVKYKGTHIMRHTCASMYFRKGVSVELIAAMLGHSVEVCRNTYIHFIEEQKREVAKLITDFDQVNI